MAGTVTIPLVTLTPGAHDFGPANVADADTTALVTVDRTVTNGGVQGFNGQPATTAAQVQVQQSNDGGATWKLIGYEGIVGGQYTSPHTGLPYASAPMQIGFDPGTGRQAKATIVVSGASVAVSGSLTIS
jgi:hypothetical protein